MAGGPPVLRVLDDESDPRLCHDAVVEHNEVHRALASAQHEGAGTGELLLMAAVLGESRDPTALTMEQLLNIAQVNRGLRELVHSEDGAPWVRAGQLVAVARPVLAP